MKKKLILCVCILTALCIMSGSFAYWQKEVTITANITVRKKEPLKPKAPVNGEEGSKTTNDNNTQEKGHEESSSQ